MQLTFEPINGICFGIEYISAEESEDAETVLLDLMIFRIIIQW